MSDEPQRSPDSRWEPDPEISRARVILIYLILGSGIVSAAILLVVWWVGSFLNASHM